MDGLPGIPATVVTRPARYGPTRRHFMAEKRFGSYCWPRAVVAMRVVAAARIRRRASEFMNKPPMNGAQFIIGNVGAVAWPKVGSVVQYSGSRKLVDRPRPGLPGKI